MKKKRCKNSFNSILKKIKDVEIQGAEDVAKAGIKAFFLKPKDMTDKEAANKIINTRPTEPLLQNSIDLIVRAKNQKQTKKKILNQIKRAHNITVEKANKMIKNDMNIYTHCHSSTVIDILKNAKKQKKDFVVYTTEVEPLLQGRETAKELAKANIKTIISPDLAAEHTLKKCDLFLFGADSFSRKNIVNKIGTSFLCDLSKKHNVPRYSCGISLKFTDKKLKIEKRNSKEVWDERNKNISVNNPAFDVVSGDLVTGVVSEFGILSYADFINKAKQNIDCFFRKKTKTRKHNKRKPKIKDKIEKIKEKQQKRAREKEKNKKQKQRIKKKIEHENKISETDKRYIEELENIKPQKNKKNELYKINSIAKEFFSRIFLYNNKSYDELEDEFSKKGKNTISDFCSQMKTLYYSPSDISSEQIKNLASELKKIIKRHSYKSK